MCLKRILKHLMGKVRIPRRVQLHIQAALFVKASREEEDMTHNQISYLEHLEDVRTHQVNELETARHNQATEALTASANAETVRTNKANEKIKRASNKETRRSNRKSEKQRGLERKETKRHNLATEGATLKDLGIRAQGVQVQASQAAAAHRQAAVQEARLQLEAQDVATRRYVAETGRKGQRLQEKQFKWKKVVDSTNMELTKQQISKLDSDTKLVNKQIEKLGSDKEAVDLKNEWQRTQNKIAKATSDTEIKKALADYENKLADTKLKKSAKTKNTVDSITKVVQGISSLVKDGINIVGGVKGLKG